MPASQESPDILLSYLSVMLFLVRKSAVKLVMRCLNNLVRLFFALSHAIEGINFLYYLISKLNVCVKRIR